MSQASSSAAVLAAPELRAVYLHAGQIAAFREPARISTILGSCVAVCLWDQVAGVGGMNHFVLPEADPGSTSPRFAGPALEILFERVSALGAAPERLQAKIFGGACLMGDCTSERSIGLRNVEFVYRRLRALRTPVVAEDVGGRRGRKLIFETPGGDAWVRLLTGGQA